MYLEAKGSAKIPLNYLPLQLVKHSAILMFQNERVGEFLYYLDGTPTLPEPCKVLVDETFLDTSHIKYIKSNRKRNFFEIEFFLWYNSNFSKKQNKKVPTTKRSYFDVSRAKKSK